MAEFAEPCFALIGTRMSLDNQPNQPPSNAASDKLVKLYTEVWRWRLRVGIRSRRCLWCCRM